MGDEEFILKTETPSAVGYATSKAALNAMIAKYANQYKSENIKFLSLSPGWVKTEASMSSGNFWNGNGLLTDIYIDSQVVGGLFAYMLSSFQKVDPTIKDMISVVRSIELQLAVIDGLTLENSGRFISQHGTKNWF
jgi:NAD(P)-dependent dehydrogenase (short-subunit alcohol dehydrogenase family)